MSLFFAFSETDITTKFFYSSIIGVGVSAFFIFLLFWLSNQKAMFNGPKQFISKNMKIIIKKMDDIIFINLARNNFVYFKYLQSN